VVKNDGFGKFQHGRELAPSRAFPDPIATRSASLVASAINEACCRKKKIVVAMATAINQANATFANRANWSPFPPVRNVVLLVLAVFLAMQRAEHQVVFQKSFSFRGKPREHPGFSA
jgi:hypothetical protein